jgi:hypothetical protein
MLATSKVGPPEDYATEDERQRQKQKRSESRRMSKPHFESDEYNGSSCLLQAREGQVCYHHSSDLCHIDDVPPENSTS